MDVPEEKDLTPWGNTPEELDQLMRRALLKVIARRIHDSGEASTRTALVWMFQPKLDQASAEALADDLIEQAR